MQFRGSFPALITPMKNGEVDEAAYRKFVNWQIEQGSHGLVPVGTTGESPTLDPDEHKRVIEICIDEVRGRVPVIAGTGSNSTAEAIDYTVHAKEAGADAADLAPMRVQEVQPVIGVIEEVSKRREARGHAPLADGEELRLRLVDGLPNLCRILVPDAGDPPRGRDQVPQDRLALHDPGVLRREDGRRRLFRERGEVAPPADRLELAIVENVQRQDLNPIELGHAYQALARAGHTQE